MTERYRARADRWVECHDLDDAQLAERIRADGIDILVDLGGHTDRNRLLAFARHPAPVQITYLGHPATSGLSAIDYRVSDRQIGPEPPATAIAGSEAPLRLAHGYFCYAPVPDSPDVGPLPLDWAGYVTFGCLNQVTKLTPTLLAAWGEILRRLPRARLWLQ